MCYFAEEKRLARNSILLQNFQKHNAFIKMQIVKIVKCSTVILKIILMNWY